MEKSTAILINRHRLTESSLIVHWCSAETGLFKTVAKGALRPKSVFTGQLDLFVTCELAFIRSKVSDLHTLNELHLVEPRLALRTNYARILAATYFSKLVEMVVESETPLGEIHELLRLSLDYLNTHDPSERLIQRFENKLCAELGLGTIQKGGAALLHETFHRALPPQRELVFREIQRFRAKDSPSSHDFA